MYFRGSKSRQQQAASQLLQEAHQQAFDITCTDVLMALEELGSDGLTKEGLYNFVQQHIHGLEDDLS